MKYRGKESLPMIDMVLRVRYVLEELGIAVPWNEDGPLCELVVPYNGSSVKIRHEFSAETARLFVKTILVEPISADRLELIRKQLLDMASTERMQSLVTKAGLLGCSEVIEVLPKDVTTLFMGQLLDRSTKHLISLAEQVGVLPTRRPT